MGGARGGEYYISKPRWSSGKIYAPGDPSLGLKKDILFLEIVYFHFLGSSEAAMGGGAQRPFGVFMSPKRRVREAHGRARAAKTH
jgi:hypothetical protein